jgi:predicted dehydrogenase
MAKIRVGLIGSGFVAELHMYAYKRVYGVDVEVAAVVSRGDHVEPFARKHGIAQTHRAIAHSLPTRRSMSSIFALRRPCTRR